MSTPLSGSGGGCVVGAWAGCGGAASDRWTSSNSAWSSIANSRDLAAATRLALERPVTGDHRRDLTPLRMPRRRIRRRQGLQSG
jgi:hypothetical protein